MRYDGSSAVYAWGRAVLPFSRDKPKVEARVDCCAGWPRVSLSAREGQALATAAAVLESESKSHISKAPAVDSVVKPLFALCS